MIAVLVQAGKILTYKMLWYSRLSLEEDIRYTRWYTGWSTFLVLLLVNPARKEEEEDEEASRRREMSVVCAWLRYSGDYHLFVGVRMTLFNPYLSCQNQNGLLACFYIRTLPIMRKSAGFTVPTMEKNGNIAVAISMIK